MIILTAIMRQAIKLQKETKKDSPVVVEEKDTEIVETQAPAPSKEIPTQPEVSSSFIAEIEQAIFCKSEPKKEQQLGLPALAYNNTMEHYARVKITRHG